MAIAGCCWLRSLPECPECWNHLSLAEAGAFFFAAGLLAALAPSLATALILLLIRAALSQMDVPTRSSCVMAVVTEPGRPAAASFTSVPRSLASGVSPALSGALFAASTFARPLLICGALKIVYDLLLLAQFRHVRPPEES